MKLFKTFLIVALILAVGILHADDFTINTDGWELDVNEADFGLDIGVSGGYTIPLNLNNKPENRDIAENFDYVAPSIFARAGVGAFIDEEKLPLNGSLGFEYSRTTFENDSLDLVFNCFALYERINIYPAGHLHIVSGSGTGLYLMDQQPKLENTLTFADYTSDIEARVNKPHIFNNQEVGIGVNFGKRPRFEFAAGARLDTYYPRYVFWPEMVRGLTTGAVTMAFNVAADRTDIWALKPVGKVVAMTLEVFNLNFYPEKVGESHQHFFTPTVTLTYHF